MGTPDFSVPTLEALIKAGHSIVGVYCQPDKQKGRGKQVQMPPVKVAALKHNLPVFQPVTLRDEQVQAELENLNPDVVVVIAYGKILPPWLIHIVETDILCGETTGQLFERMAVLGGETIVPVLTRWVNGEIVATPQDDTMATHTAKITKEMGHIDWSKSAHEIVNLIRGLNPAPGCYTYLDGKRLKVWSGEVVPSDTTHCLIDIHGKHVPIAISATTIPGTIVSKIAGLGVFCGDGNIILLTEVQPENKKRISAIDFINGHQIKEGIVFGDSI